MGETEDSEPVASASNIMSASEGAVWRWSAFLAKVAVTCGWYLICTVGIANFLKIILIRSRADLYLL